MAILFWWDKKEICNYHVILVHLWEKKNRLTFQDRFLRFPDFRCSICFLFAIFLENMLVRYRGINNKGVLERSWTKWKVLRAISSTLKFQFTVKCWKESKTKSCQSSTEYLRMVRALPPDTPRPPQFQPELWKNSFCEKLDFSRFTNRSLVSGWCSQR